MVCCKFPATAKSGLSLCFVRLVSSFNLFEVAINELCINKFEVWIAKMHKRLIFVFCGLMVAQNCFALSVDELKRGLNQALASKGRVTALASYVTGYVHGSAEYGRTLGLVCDESGLRSTKDELKAVLTYIDANPKEWPDGAQLLINRALTSPKCQN